LAFRMRRCGELAVRLPGLLRHDFSLPEARAAPLWNGLISRRECAEWANHCKGARSAAMWSQLFLGGLVSLLNFGIHALMTGFVVEATRHTAKRTDHLHAFLRLTSLLTVTMIFLMIAHVVEIAVWAVYYYWESAAPQGTTAFEFAFENYTALG